MFIQIFKKYITYFLGKIFYETILSTAYDHKRTQVFGSGGGGAAGEGPNVPET